MPEAVYDWLDEKHPEWGAREKGWRREEKRHAGEDDVLDELIPFDWETKDIGHHLTRKAEAVYINLPRQHASPVTGHLSKLRPTPGKGRIRWMKLM